MGNRDDYTDLVDLMLRIRELSHLKKNVVILYALRGGMLGEVRATGRELADQLGLTVSTMSRARKELLEEGWLEMTRRYGQVAFYQLSEKATGEQGVVIPLRGRAM